MPCCSWQVQKFFQLIAFMTAHPIHSTSVLFFLRFVLFLESTEKNLKMTNVIEENNIGNWIMTDS